MTDAHQPDPDKMPDDDELQEPSTEKDPGEQPKDPEAEPEEEQVDHEAVGIGVIDTPDAGEPAPRPSEGEGEGAEADSAPPTDAASDEVKSDAARLDDSGDRIS
jgi:hypothetical protein